MIKYFKDNKNVIRHDTIAGSFAEITMTQILQSDGSLVLAKNINTHEPGWTVPPEYKPAEQADWDYAKMKLTAYISSL